MSANIPPTGKPRQVDRPQEPDQVVVPEEVADTSRLARLLMRILRELAGLRRRWAPQRLDFEDREVDGTGATLYRFRHNFRGRVRWWPVDWTDGASGPNLVRDESSTDNELVLVSHTAGTVTLRVEEAG